MGEPYRTLLGHFRHEVGHYYWTVLVEAGPATIERFRAAVRRRAGGLRRGAEAPLRQRRRRADWQERFVSAYASSHPWEDWAETWAHYLHIVDTLETAARLRDAGAPESASARRLATAIDFDPHDNVEPERLVAAWLPLTFAVNSLNRSMGQPDLYPFVLSPPCRQARLHPRAGPYGAGDASRSSGHGVLHAVIDRLRRPVGPMQDT